MQEVKNTLKRTRTGKAAGIDEVGPELRRADLDGTAMRLPIARCYNRLWNTGRWPEMWATRQEPRYVCSRLTFNKSSYIVAKPGRRQRQKKEN